MEVAYQLALDCPDVGLLNGANRRLLGNHWFAGKATQAIDENLHRRSWRLAAAAYVLNHYVSGDRSVRQEDTLQRRVERCGGKVIFLAGGVPSAAGADAFCADEPGADSSLPSGDGASATATGCPSPAALVSEVDFGGDEDGPDASSSSEVMFEPIPGLRRVRGRGRGRRARVVKSEPPDSPSPRSAADPDSASAGVAAAGEAAGVAAVAALEDATPPWLREPSRSRGGRGGRGRRGRRGGHGGRGSWGRGGPGRRWYW